MKKLAFLIGIVLAIAAPNIYAATAANTRDGGLPADNALFKTISKLDSELFDSFNHCGSPEELQKHASYFAPDVEFYHDKAGVTWSRQDYITNTRNNACGKYRRELVAGSLEVFPIKDYGAIEQGKQRFCEIKSGKCFGIADFMIVWHHQYDRWEITRAFSYGHRSIQ